VIPRAPDGCRDKPFFWLINPLLVQADDLPNQLAHFKSYTARQLIDYLQDINAERLVQ
jgi:hypothetical protein